MRDLLSGSDILGVPAMVHLWRLRLVVQMRALLSKLSPRPKFAPTLIDVLNTVPFCEDNGEGLQHRLGLIQKKQCCVIQVSHHLVQHALPCEISPIPSTSLIRSTQPCELQCCCYSVATFWPRYQQVQMVAEKCWQQEVSRLFNRSCQSTL